MPYANKTKRKEYNKRYQKEHLLEKACARRGITVEKYQELSAKQGGVCAICRREKTVGRGQNLYIDHDHATGEVRGLLCHGCNLVLGYADDRVETLRAAIEYLQPVT